MVGGWCEALKVLVGPGGGPWRGCGMTGACQPCSALSRPFRRSETSIDAGWAWPVWPAGQKLRSVAAVGFGRDAQHCGRRRAWGHPPGPLRAPLPERDRRRSDRPLQGDDRRAAVLVRFAPGGAFACPLPLISPPAPTRRELSRCFLEDALRSARNRRRGASLSSLLTHDLNDRCPDRSAQCR